MRICTGNAQWCLKEDYRGTFLILRLKNQGKMDFCMKKHPKIHGNGARVRVLMLLEFCWHPASKNFHCNLKSWYCVFQQKKPYKKHAICSRDIRDAIRCVEITKITPWFPLFLQLKISLGRFLKVLFTKFSLTPPISMRFQQTFFPGKLNTQTFSFEKTIFFPGRGPRKGRIVALGVRARRIHHPPLEPA